MDYKAQTLNFFEDEAPKIKGLRYVKNFISSEREQDLITKIDSLPWQNVLKRRVQHYGYRYDYKLRKTTENLYLGPLPDFLEDLAQTLHKDRYIVSKPDQVIVNEYQPGQGISPHIDCVPCFGDEIISLSLGSGAIMQLTNGEQKEGIYLDPASLIILSDEARYQWTHAIPARRSDLVNGDRMTRGRRLSLTFRTMKFD